MMPSPLSRAQSFTVRQNQVPYIRLSPQAKLSPLQQGKSSPLHEAESLEQSLVLCSEAKPSLLHEAESLDFSLILYSKAKQVPCTRLSPSSRAQSSVTKQNQVACMRLSLSIRAQSSITRYKLSPLHEAESLNQSSVLCNKAILITKTKLNPKQSQN